MPIDPKVSQEANPSKRTASQASVQSFRCSLYAACAHLYALSMVTMLCRNCGPFNSALTITWDATAPGPLVFYRV